MASSFESTFGPNSSFWSKPIEERLSFALTWQRNNPDNTDLLRMILSERETLVSENETLVSENETLLSEKEEVILRNFLKAFKPMADCTRSGYHYPSKKKPATVTEKEIERELDWVEQEVFSDKFWNAHYMIGGRNVHSEDSVTRVVTRLLESIIKGLELDGIIEVIEKRTLAGAECDLLLVYTTNLLPFATLEIKKPPHEEKVRKKLFFGGRGGSRVAGQVLEQMNGIQLFGFHKVYGMLSTYNHYRMFCTGELNEESDNSEAMLEAWQYLKLKKDEGDDESPSVSATSQGELNNNGELNKDKVEDAPSPEQQQIKFKKDRKKERANLYGSNVFPNIDGMENNADAAMKIVRLLTLFILKACTTLKKLLDDPERLDNMFVYQQMPCRFLSSKNEHEFAFGTISTLTSLKLDSYDPKLENIHVIRHLGTGASGNCCLGVSQTGSSCCAVKFYHEAEKQDTTTLADQEFENWKNIYGKRNYGPPMARRLKLQAGHCLVMPYLQPIQVSERQQLLKVPEGSKTSRIEQTLRDFAAKGFIHSDIKWRHFGYWRENIFLLDLGEVDNAGGEENVDSWVNESVRYLEAAAAPKQGSCQALPFHGEDESEIQEGPKTKRKRRSPRRKC